MEQEPIPGEPTFTLLARDQQAPGLIRAWARTRLIYIAYGVRGEEERKYVDHAFKIADEMDRWRLATELRK